MAAGAGGHAGVAVGAASELDATAGALKDRAKQDIACHVIAIGLVESR